MKECSIHLIGDRRVWSSIFFYWWLQNIEFRIAYFTGHYKLWISVLFIELQIKKCEALYYLFNWRLQNTNLHFIHLIGDYKVWSCIYSFNWRLQRMRFRIIHLIGDHRVWSSILFKSWSQVMELLITHFLGLYKTRFFILGILVQITK